MNHHSVSSSGLKLKAIAAMAENRVIGRDGQLPWHLPEDLKTFKRLTSGHPIVMGRNTWESLPLKPLPNRRNIVISTSLDKSGVPAKVDHFPTIGDFIRSGISGTVWLIGGASLYSQLLPDCEELFLSFVYGEPDGDVFFPEFESLFALKEVIETHDSFELRHYTRKTSP